VQEKVEKMEDQVESLHRFEKSPNEDEMEVSGYTRARGFIDKKNERLREEREERDMMREMDPDMNSEGMGEEEEDEGY
jgi:hypothetical protein